MAISVSSRYILFFLVPVLFFTVEFLEPVDAKSPQSFTFERFDKNQTFDSEISLHGDAEIINSTVISSSGRVMFNKPMRFVGTSPGFSTYLSFSIAKGHGETLAFSLVPNHRRTAVLKVTFGSYVEIGVGRRISIKTSNLSPLESVIDAGERIHSWIDYDGVSKRVEVRLSKSRAWRPSSSVVSYPVDLSSVLWRDEMLVGLSSSSGRNSTQIGSVLYSWSFVVKHGAPYTMHSEPLNPYSFSVKSDEDNTPVHARRNSPWKFVIALVIGAAFGSLVASVVSVLRSKAVERHPVAPIEYHEHPVEIGHGKVVAGVDKLGDDVVKEKA